MANANVIVPPAYLGQLSGVMYVSVGTRIVKAKLLMTCYRFARKHLPKELPEDYFALAELVQKAAREFGTEIEESF